MENEFGFHTHQMRSQLTVKNAWVFEVLNEYAVTQLLAHGDIDDNDVLKMVDASEDRTFLVLHEENPFTGWYPWWMESRKYDLKDPTVWVTNASVLTNFSAIKVSNGDFMFKSR